MEHLTAAAAEGNERSNKRNIKVKKPNKHNTTQHKHNKSLAMYYNTERVHARTAPHRVMR